MPRSCSRSRASIGPDSKFFSRFRTVYEHPDAYDRFSTEIAAGLSYQFTREQSASVEVSLEYEDVDDFFHPDGQRHLIASLPTQYVFDNRDNKLDPKRGFRALAFAEPAHDFLTGATFVKFRGELSAYKAIDDAQRFVLAGRVAAGSIVGASVEDIPADRRFYVGGGGSVRGYEYQGIGPKDPEGNPIGGRSYMELSAEMRIQVTRNDRHRALRRRRHGVGGRVPRLGALPGRRRRRPALSDAVRATAGSTRRCRSTANLAIRASPSMPASARRSERCGSSRLFLRIFRYTIYATLAFVIAALAVLTLTERGRDNLAGLISDFASSPGRTVKIAGIDGIWSGNLTLQSLVLEDEDGPWLVGAQHRRRLVAAQADHRRRFDADRIFAERIEVARMPKPTSEPKEEAGSFSLPVSIDLKQIDLPDIALGPALAGGVASVAAKGSARAEASPLQIVSQLNIARSDGRAGNIDASIDFAPADNRLDLDIRASEPQGGILANLLKLPGEPPVEINVSGSGPAADWSGSGTFAVDGTVITRVEGEAPVHRQGKRHRGEGRRRFRALHAGGPQAAAVRKFELRLCRYADLARAASTSSAPPSRATR